MAEELRSRNPPDIAAPGIGIVSAYINFSIIFSISILSLMALNIMSVVQAKGEKKRKVSKIGRRKEKTFCKLDRKII
jgi:hypothetical protein